MYRSDLKSRDKGGAIAAVIAIHAALLFAFLHLSGRMNLGDPQSVLRVFDVTETPPPPPITPEKPKPAEQSQKPREREGAASEKNIKSEATPIVAPKPKIEPPFPLPVNVTQTPNQGAAPNRAPPTSRVRERAQAGLVRVQARAAPEAGPAEVAKALRRAPSCCRRAFEVAITRPTCADDCPTERRLS